MAGFKRVVVLFAFLAIAAGVGAETIETVSDTSVVVVRISRMDSDPGISWLSETWLATDRETPLRDFLREVSYREAAVTVLPSGPGEPQRIVMVIDAAAAPSTNLLDRTILGGLPTSARTVEGIAVTFTPNPPEGEDFAAYAIVRNTLILGTDEGAVAEVLSGSPVSRSDGYRQMTGFVDTDSDGLLFADNEDLRFADFLAPLERKWQMSLLLSAADLEWMASGFDVVDSNRVAGTIVFKGQSVGAVPDIVDDAEFLGETFRRKFVAEKIDYTSNVSVEGTVVTLEFTVEGLEPLWLRLFEQGVLSVIRP
jgi:hypothetical protein